MMINRPSDKQILVLKYLARYKFLSYRQMQRLGVDKHRSNLSTLVSSLRDRRVPYVKKIPHRFGIESKHFLTAKGKDLLIKLRHLDEDEIHYVKGTITTDTQDQKHRTSTVDIQIELDYAAQQNAAKVLFCDRYFDMTGNNRVAKNLKSKTAIVYEGRKTLKADMTFMLKTTTQRELYLLELENGLDAEKAIPKCDNHRKAILLGSANELYDFKSGYRTLWVFEHKSTMESVLGKLSTRKDFKDVQEYFLFKPLEEIGENFFGGWTNLAGRERKMYY